MRRLAAARRSSLLALAGCGRAHDRARARPRGARRRRRRRRARAATARAPRRADRHGADRLHHPRPGVRPVLDGRASAAIDDAHKESDVAVVLPRAGHVLDRAHAPATSTGRSPSSPTGMVVSLPDARRSRRSIRRAVQAGIPVVTINSGSDDVQAARRARPRRADRVPRRASRPGERMAAGGVRTRCASTRRTATAALDQRCRGVRPTALRRIGGTLAGARDPASRTRAGAQRRVAEAVAAGRIDGILTLGPGGASPALDAVRASGLTTRSSSRRSTSRPTCWRAVSDGKMLFAIDQQPYLQGYLPVMLLAENKRYGVFPDQGEVVITGPHFVTQDTAQKALALSRRGIRRAAQREPLSGTSSPNSCSSVAAGSSVRPGVHLRALDHRARRRDEPAEALGRRPARDRAAAARPPRATRSIASRCARTSAASTPGASAARRASSSCDARGQERRARQKTTTPALMNSPRSTRGTTRTTA